MLCNELLKPTLQHRSVPGVTKSGVIQQLSLLIGFLDWIGPAAPNSALCISCKAVIQHVLDQALDGLPIDRSHHGGFDRALDFNFDIGTDMGEFFNFDLLDTFDWLKHASSQHNRQPEQDQEGESRNGHT